MFSLDTPRSGVLWEAGLYLQLQLVVGGALNTSPFYVTAAGLEVDSAAPFDVSDPSTLIARVCPFNVTSDPVANVRLKAALPLSGVTGRFATPKTFIGYKGGYVVIFAENGASVQISDGCNAPPIAEAGPDVTILTSMLSGTTIKGVATDSNGDTLTYRWLDDTGAVLLGPATVFNGQAPLDLAAVTTLGVGGRTLTLAVTDGQDSASDTVLLTVHNTPPDASCPSDLVVEAGAAASVGGSVADFDGGSLSFQWLLGETVLGSGTATVPVGGTSTALSPLQLQSGHNSPPANLLDLGRYTLTLRAVDGWGASASCETKVNVVDTTKPEVVALLVPVGEDEDEDEDHGNGHDDEDRFEVHCAATDSWDNDPKIVASYFLLPDLSACEVVFKTRPREEAEDHGDRGDDDNGSEQDGSEARIEVSTDGEKGCRVTVFAADPAALWASLVREDGATVGVPVSDGQVVQLEEPVSENCDDHDDHARSGERRESRQSYTLRNGVLARVSGPWLTLVCVARDASGNEARAQAEPDF